MTGFFSSLLAFLVAISVLVAVHEFGHFWVARRLGVKVLRFSIGFGRPIYLRRFGPDRTEFAVAAIPLGGYVKMLDEREGPVAAEEAHRAFNRKSPAVRSAIAVAGPLFNFIFAVFAYWVMYGSGVPGIKPVVDTVQPGSYAASAGFEHDDEVVAIDGRVTPTWDDVTVELLKAALDDSKVALQVRRPDGASRALVLDFGEAPGVLDKGGLLGNLGIVPRHEQAIPVIDRVIEGGAAADAGLRPGDRIVSADNQPIEGWDDWVLYVRARPGQSIETHVLRDDLPTVLKIVPRAVEQDGKTIGQIGATVRQPDASSDPLRTTVRYAPLEAGVMAFSKTWEVSALTLRTLWGMISGRASVENISGPISIAQYAGYSAQVGFSSFLKFLAIVSISLGVLNLLPVPVLDGGHLLYYTFEWLTGRPLSDAAQAVGMRIGIAVLLVLMGLAFYNDISRVFGAS